MKMEKEIKLLCEKLSKGYKGKRGQEIQPNPYINFKKFAEYLLAEGYRKTTVKEYLKKIHKFMAEINEDNLKAWVTKIEAMRDYSQESKLRLNYFVHVILRKYLKAIHKEEWINLLPPTSLVKKVKSQPKYQGVTEKEWKVIIKNLEGVFRDTTILMRRLGLRVGEIINMKKSWLVKRNNKFIIFIPKSVSKSRRDEEVPLDTFSYKIIAKYLKNKSDKDYVFTITENNVRRKRRKLNHNDFLLAYRKLFKNFKIKVHPHTFRHQFAHDLEKHGFFESEIQILMRHVDISITGRYLTKEKDRTFDKFYRLREGK